MDRETISDYLARAGMEAPQSTALSNILGQLATRADVHLLEQRMDARFDLVDERFARLRSEMNARFEAVDARFDAIDARFEAINARFDSNDIRFEARCESVDARFDALEQRIMARMAALEARMTWRLVGGIGFFAVVMTLLDLFVD